MSETRRDTDAHETDRLEIDRREIDRREIDRREGARGDSGHRTPRVLVAEDSATQAAALAALLEEHGYDAVIARDGEEALRCVREEPFDLVLSDIVMPGLSGYEVCRRIKTELGMRDLPVVLLTGLSDPMDIIRGLECGADNYITKPYERAHLLARVRQVLDNREMRRERHDGSEGVEITFLGARFTITADREQVLDLLVSSYEELVRTNQAVRQAEQRSRFLAEASGVLAKSLDAETILGSLARFAVPAMADVCVADLVGEDGKVTRVEVACATPALEEAAALLRAEPMRVQQPAVLARVLQQRAPLLVPEASAAELAALAPDGGAIASAFALGLRSLLAVPLVTRGTVVGALTFLGATTRRRYASEELTLALELARAAAIAVDNARLYRAAQLATRARDDLLAIVSHDLRNPIHAIYMASSFLIDVLPEGDDEMIALSLRQAQVIRRSAQRANTLIGDLLDITRIESGRLRVSAQPMDASELVADAVNEALPLAEQKGLELTSAVADPLPRVSADRARVAQVFANLLGNAI
ncbi:MAG TPA: hybrid sensor histidine kinase/response regulator, partial [Gemmatimonadaceae bacterium]|nr:hybrid sensor histidine kinase/response regulator [Gemmatimonadaceae bacterium]